MIHFFDRIFFFFFFLSLSFLTLYRLLVRSMRARALLACGRLDEARDECNAGIKEAKNNYERIVAISLGSMRAQIHTAEGEDQGMKLLF